MVSAVDPSFITTAPVPKQGMKNTLQTIKDEITALQASVDALETNPGTVPVGAVAEWYTAYTEPAGWMIADGRAINRTTYSTYFALVGTTFGEGNGTTTFNIPTLPEIAPGRRQMVYVGGSGSGANGGELQLFFSNTLLSSELLYALHTRAQWTLLASSGNNPKASAIVAATASTTITLRKNGTSIGTIVFGIGGTVATVTIATAVSFVADDIFTITAPSTADATLADVLLTLPYSRS